MSDDERGVQTEPQTNRVSDVVDSQDETSVAPDSLSELPPSARNLRRLEDWDGSSVPPSDEAAVEALIAEAQRLGLEVRKPQKGNRRGKFYACIGQGRALSCNGVLGQAHPGGAAYGRVPLQNDGYRDAGGSGCRVSGTPGVQGALMELIHPDKYTLALRPGIGDWTIAGDQVIIGIGPLGTRRIRDEIPSWVLNRPASISGEIALKKEPLDSFLGQITRVPRRF